MQRYHALGVGRVVGFLVFLVVAGVAVTPVLAGDYAALEGVKGIKAVFDVTQGSPQMANVVFWAVRNVYQDQSVRSLEMQPQVAVVFHGPASKLLSSDRKGFKESDAQALDEFAGMIRQMKKDGVRLEVCGYALKVLGIDPATILPEVDVVGNGFISVVGYQAQGYSVVSIN